MSTEYKVPAPLMQQIASTLAALPWGQVNGIMSQLVPVIQQQDQAQPDATATAADPAEQGAAS